MWIIPFLIFIIDLSKLLLFKVKVNFQVRVLVVFWNEKTNFTLRQLIMTEFVFWTLKQIKWFGNFNFQIINQSAARTISPVSQSESSITFDQSESSTQIELHNFRFEWKTSETIHLSILREIRRNKLFSHHWSRKTKSSLLQTIRQWGRRTKSR